MKHSRFLFEDDDAFQQEKPEAYFKVTNGCESYLYDWHTHPFGKFHLSGIDKHALYEIASTPSSGIKKPSDVSYDWLIWQLGYETYSF